MTNSLKLFLGLEYDGAGSMAGHLNGCQVSFERELPGQHIITVAVIN